MKRNYLAPDAEQEFEKTLENKTPEEIYILGDSFYKNKEIESNAKKAFVCYQKAAMHGHGKAQLNLGVCYEKGIGIDKDDKQASVWFEKAAAQGNAVAQSNLGYYYEKGIGIDKDEKQAFAWYEKAAAQGLGGAQCRLGICYAKGKGIEKNAEKAAQIFKKAASEGVKFAKLWSSKAIGYNADFILEQIKNSKDYYIPCQFPPPADQNDGYCGSAAFATLVNYAGCLPHPLYASHYEKKDAGVDVNNHTDEVLYQLQHSTDEYRSDGSQYNIFSFQKLADDFGIKGCEAVLKENYTEEEYTAALLKALKENYALILPCDENDEMPVKGKGKDTHWVSALGYFCDDKGKYHLVVTHHGFYCKWSIHDLYESNKQLPDDNPHVKGGSLKKFRYSFFKVPVKHDKEMLSSEAAVKKLSI